jgi:acyl transferase domain-containing protein
MAGVEPDVVIGQSFGEWAALTTAGVWSVGETARLISERDCALRRTRPPAGGLLALGIGVKRARHLAALVDDWRLDVALDNGPRQTVLTGPSDALDEAEQVAVALGMRATRVKAAYPYHSRLLQPAAERFAAALGDVPCGPPTCRVYSPIAGRYVDDPDDIRWLLIHHMTTQVSFREALYAVQDDEVTTFVECGGKAIVTGIIASALPEAVTFAPLVRRDATTFGEVVAALGGGMRPARPVRRSAAQAVKVVPAAPATAPMTRLPEREELISRLRDFYAGRLGYPVSVLTDDADLEADLGVDSLRQIETAAAAFAEFGVPGRPPDGDLARCRTLPQLAELLHASAGVPPNGGPG